MIPVLRVVLRCSALPARNAFRARQAHVFTGMRHSRLFTSSEPITSLARLRRPICSVRCLSTTPLKDSVESKVKDAESEDSQQKWSGVDSSSNDESRGKNLRGMKKITQQVRELRCVWPRDMHSSFLACMTTKSCCELNFVAVIGW